MSNDGVMQQIVQRHPTLAMYSREWDRHHRATHARRKAWREHKEARAKGDPLMAHAKLIQVRYWDRQVAKATP